MKTTLSTIVCLSYGLMALACSVGRVDVTKAGNAAATAKANRFDLAAVTRHFAELNGSHYFRDEATTFSCVDARRTTPVFGTPGGDFGELVVAIEAYATSKRLVLNQQLVRTVLRRFFDEHISDIRPLYYHTDYTKLQSFFDDLKTIHNIAATMFPADRPEQSNLWLDLYVQAKYQGCGHLRLMMQNPAQYGLTNINLPVWLLKEYINLFWDLPVAKKSHIEFSVKLGGLDGRAVVILKNAGPKCVGYSPKYSTALRGSSVFLFHQGAVENFRNQTLTTFFGRYDRSLNPTDFRQGVATLFNTQLGATLTSLDPVNAVDIFTVSTTTEGRWNKAPCNK